MTRGLYCNEQCKKKKNEGRIPAKTITSVQCKHLLVWVKTDVESIEHTEGGNLQKLGEVRLIKVDQLTKNRLLL